jgi:hypothetical protein
VFNERGIRLGSLMGLEVSFGMSMLAGIVVLLIAFFVVGRWLFHAGFAAAAVGAVLLTLAHFAQEAVHNLGHATAARRQGAPMTGFQFWGVLAMSQYPPDEPELPARVHIQRALGGPALSAVLAVLLGVLWVVAARLHFHLPWVFLVAFLDGVLVFSLGALLPLGFNDGSTIIRWSRRA